MGRYLLVGVPRSGTSWTGQALGHADGVRYVDEPDGFRDPFPFRVMLELGENPLLAPGASAPEYERLWAGAFAGGRPSRDIRARIAARAYHAAGTDARRRARNGEGTTPWLRLAAGLARPPVEDPDARHVVVKSVQCTRSIEWIHSRFAPRVVVILRNPLNTLASWRDLDFVRNSREGAALAGFARDRWGVEEPDAGAPQLAHQAFTFGVLTAALLSAASRHPEWTVVRHEQLCSDAPVELRTLAEQLGLTWTAAAEQFVRDSDRSGEGFATARVASQQPERWRERLSPADVELIRGVLGTFPESALADC